MSLCTVRNVATLSDKKQTKCEVLNEYYNSENTVKSKKKNILFSVVGIVIAVTVVIGCTQIFEAYNKGGSKAKYEEWELRRSDNLS